MNKVAESIEEVLQAYLDGKTIFYEGDELKCIKENYAFPPVTISEIESKKWSIKDRTININGFEVPEPNRGNIDNGDRYWFPSCNDGIVEDYNWANDETDKKIMKNGLLHLTKEAAELHLQALLSFTKTED